MLVELYEVDIFAKKIHIDFNASRKRELYDFWNGI